VIPDQIFDNTKGRAYSFFGSGLVAHIGVAEPYCPALSQTLARAVLEAGGTVHRGGIFVTIEGPRFSTKAESSIYRSWGIDIIGMTAVPEAQLAREAEMCYATMAHITDYDVWHEEEEAVNVEMLIENLMANAELSKRSIASLIPLLADERPCDCAHALSSAFITQRDLIPQETIRRLGPIVGKYFDS
jgi:5'-methylthioadenosine phosphorylase